MRSFWSWLVGRNAARSRTAATFRRTTGTANGLLVYAVEAYTPMKRCSPTTFPAASKRLIPM